jgi:hypothetical protein
VSIQPPSTPVSKVARDAAVVGIDLEDRARPPAGRPDHLPVAAHPQVVRLVRAEVPGRGDLAARQIDDGDGVAEHLGRAGVGDVGEALVGRDRHLVRLASRRKPRHRPQRRGVVKGQRVFGDSKRPGTLRQRPIRRRKERARPSACPDGTRAVLARGVGKGRAAVWLGRAGLGVPREDVGGARLREVEVAELFVPEAVGDQRVAGRLDGLHVPVVIAVAVRELGRR